MSGEVQSNDSSGNRAESDMESFTTSSASTSGGFVLVGTDPDDSIVPNINQVFVYSETWIPYQIKADSEITIRIYSVTGELARRLALGHKSAGLYVSRDRAAYWDSRNEFAEPVANGIYYYSIHAGDFSTTRKMTVKK